MKKILLSIFTLAVVGITAKVEAQTGCTGGANNCALAVSNSVITIVSQKDTTTVNGSGCVVVFNVAFDLSYNSGNKDIFIHSYLAADYPNYFPCSSGALAAPTNTILGTTPISLGKSFLDIGLDNGVARGLVGVPVNVPIYTSYNVDPTVELTSPSNSAGMTCTKTFISGTTDRVELKNVRVVLNTSCGAGVVVKTDVWSRNGTNGPAQCWVAGIVQGFNDPKVLGFKNCDRPDRKYTLGITTVDPTPTTLTYSVWIDMNTNGVVDGGDIQAVGPVNYPNFSSSNPFTTGAPVSYPPYSSQIGVADKDLIIVAKTPNIGNEINVIFTNPQGCISLPVDFKSFTASRNRSSVLLKWETSSEFNNSGFAVERNVNGTWEQIAFVNSQAANGNSDALLTYTYSDLNNAKGITQYRIKQVDFDNKSKYTEIRSVRGLDQIGKVTVYPNPTSNGTVNVVFDDASATRTISVLDMSGRTLKQINNVTNNNITIDNLQPGMYTLRIMVPETGEQTVQKIVVNKR